MAPSAIALVTRSGPGVAPVYGSCLPLTPTSSPSKLRPMIPCGFICSREGGRDGDANGGGRGSLGCVRTVRHSAPSCPPRGRAATSA
eukprot:526122-Prymnesium_polylepis.1